MSEENNHSSQRGMDHIELLEQFEMAQQGGATSLDQWQKLSGSDKSISVLIDFLLIEIEANGWSVDSISSAMSILSSEGGSKAEHISLISSIFDLRSATGAQLSLSDFPKMEPDVAAEALRVKGEPWSLGDEIAHQFLVEQRLGRGSFGVVFKAMDRRGNVNVALKTPPLNSSGLNLARQLLEGEVLVSKRLGDNVCLSMSEVMEDSNGHPFVSMQHIHGGSLHDQLNGEAVTPSEAARITSRIAKAISRAHSASVVHRDLKPDNILMDEDGQVYITDFGLAIFEDEEQVDRDGEVAGTFGFLPPDALLGAANQLDGRSDIWAIGATLYQLLTGEQAARSNNRESALVAAIVAATPRLEFPEQVPEALREVVKGCIEPNPLHRFVSAADVAFVLEAFLASSTAAIPHRPSLLAWRCGKILGTLHRYMAVASDSATGDLKTQQMRPALWFGAAEAASDLERLITRSLLSYGVEIELTSSPADAIDTLRKAFYRGPQGQLADDELDAAEHALSDWASATMSTIQAAFDGETRLLLALLEFGLLSTAALGPTSIHGGIVDVARRSGLPEICWQHFTSAVLGESTPKQRADAFDRLDRSVERFLVFGTA